jgi:hypothetical protein
MTMPTYREDPAGYQRARYARLRAGGRCTDCGYPTPYSRCEFCSGDKAKQRRKSGKKARPDRRLYP